MNAVSQCYRLLMVFILLSGAASSALSDEFLTLTRTDRLVPEHCRDFDLADFGSYTRYIIYGIEKSKAVGFTHEYPISRGGAGALWNVLKDQDSRDRLKVPKGEDPARLERDLATIERYAPDMGFDFKKEGDVLEVLSLVDLEKEYPSSQYFLTGGIAYRSQEGGNTLGELDVVVGQKSDCLIVAVGESKLGIRQLGHAKSQLRRFEAFRKAKLCSDRPARAPAFPICSAN